MQSFTLFQNFANSRLPDDPFFLISRIRASHWKNTPLFAKKGTSVVYVLGVEGPGSRWTAKGARMSETGLLWIWNENPD